MTHDREQPRLSPPQAFVAGVARDHFNRIANKDFGTMPSVDVALEADRLRVTLGEVLAILEELRAGQDDGRPL